MKVTKDYIKYLQHIDELSKKLPKDKKKELENILEVQLSMLVMMKKGSQLGSVSINFK